MQKQTERMSALINITLIRHGATKGNLERRYVGRTDESLLLSSRQSLSGHARVFPTKDSAVIYVSPLKRCLETAEALFPGMPFTIVQDFRECDFGIFEYKNYEELNGRPEYQRFIDEGGTTGFPEGESREEFSRRCVHAFGEIADTWENTDSCSPERIFVVHGGTIMSLLDAYSNPHADYFSWQTANGTGYQAIWNPIDRKFENIRAYCPI